MDRTRGNMACDKRFYAVCVTIAGRRRIVFLLHEQFIRIS